MGYRRQMRRARRAHRFRQLRYRAVTEGLFGGSRRWLAIGAAVWGLRLLDGLLNPKPDLVYRTRLRPGETFSVTEHKPGSYRAG